MFTMGIVETAKRLIWVGGLGALLGGCDGCHRERTLKGALRPEAFGIAAVDDSVVLFSEEAGVPEGVEVRTEAVPLGRGSVGPRRYAFIRSEAPEPFEAAIARVRPWVDAQSLPAGRRFAWGAVFDEDPAGGGPQRMGWRSYVLAGDVVVDGSKVEEIEAPETTGAEPAYLLVKFNPEGSKAIEKFTGDHVKQRAAILVQGFVESSPVIQEAIAGGVIRLSSPTGDTVQMLHKLGQSAAQ